MTYSIAAPKVYGETIARPDIARLAGLVDGLAQEGDPEARSILKRAADELARLVSAALDPLALPVPKVSYVGGIWRSTLVLEKFRERIQGAGLGATILPPILPPICGAILLAWEAIQYEASEDIRVRLAEELRKVNKGI